MNPDVPQVSRFSLPPDPTREHKVTEAVLAVVTPSIKAPLLITSYFREGNEAKETL